MNKTTIIFCLALSSLIISNYSVAQEKTNETKEKSHENHGFLDFNGYYDSREFSVMTLNILAKLPNRFQYFSLTNYVGNSDTAIGNTDKASELHTFYTEQNLRWGIKEGLPFDLTAQWVIRNSSVNDDLRLGIRWRLSNTPKIETVFKKLNMFYSVNFHLVQFRIHSETEFMTQIEHVYKIMVFPKLLNKRLYISGFADQNIVDVLDDSGKKTGTSLKWVTEHQLGINLIDQLYLVAEYRINDFLPYGNSGIGYGLEYKIVF